MSMQSPPPVRTESTRPADPPEERPGGVPLYVWVLLAVTLAVPVGFLLRVEGGWYDRLPFAAVKGLEAFAAALDLAPKIILRALAALAAPLIVLAILSAIVTNAIQGRQGIRMMTYYTFNTLVAMTIGLVLCQLIQPGAGTELGKTAVEAVGSDSGLLIDRLIDRPSPPAAPTPTAVADIVLNLVPRSIGDAFATNNLAQLVLVTIAFGIGLVRLRDEQRARGETRFQAVVDVLTVGFELLMKVLLWIVAVVPFAVFGVVALSVAREGFAVFLQLGWFLGVVLIGLVIQVCWYLLEMGTFARLNPLRFLGGAADVMATTFSTASTAATIPVTLRTLIDRLRVSRTSSQLAACVGTNFNNDGTALYQAVAAVFFAQAYGVQLDFGAHVLILLTTLIASVGAGGIPSGSFVTLPLIFAAVNLPVEGIPLLLTIDWFADRCRTTVNVLGDLTVAVLLDITEIDGHG